MAAASYDLHLHTCWSYDALIDPARYFAAAREQGVGTIAITDHHGFDALPELTAAAPAWPDIRYIRAAELTVTTAFGPVDLVCLGIPDPLPVVLGPVRDRYHAWQ
jgi:predicted metal-dependent phosphoesterase TrpH